VGFFLVVVVVVSFSPSSFIYFLDGGLFSFFFSVVADFNFGLLLFF